MIEISSALEQDKIIQLLNSYNKEGIQFSFIEKKGIHLYFKTTCDDLEKAAKAAKSAIKGEPWGTVLYFRSAPAQRKG